MCDKLLIESGDKTLAVFGWDADKELCIELTSEEEENIYLSRDQVNTLVNYLCDKLKDIDGLDKRALTQN